MRGASRPSFLRFCGASIPSHTHGARDPVCRRTGPLARKSLLLGQCREEGGAGDQCCAGQCGALPELSFSSPLRGETRFERETRTLWRARLPARQAQKESQASSRFLMRCLSPRSPRRLVVRASTAPSPPIVFSTSSTLLLPSFLPAPSSQILLKTRREEEPGEGAGVLLIAFCVKNATPRQSALPADRLQHTSSTLLLLLPSFPRQSSKILLKISKTKIPLGLTRRGSRGRGRARARGGRGAPGRARRSGPLAPLE